MKIEWLIFFYMAVSIAMALFDFAFLLYEKLRDARFAVRTERMAKLLAYEIDANADFPTEEHKRTIERQMRRLAGLESFDLTMARLRDDDEDRSERYLRGISEVFDRLTFTFLRKDDTRRAYFAYIVKRWYRAIPASEVMADTLLSFVREGSLYARQNALEALARVGSARTFAEAIGSIDIRDDFHHPKLVTEAAMAFAGDAHALADELLTRFEGFSSEQQTAVINYLRMVRQGDEERFRVLMQQEDANREVRLACMRYFMTNRSEAVADSLRTIAASTDAGEWEFSSVATSVLAAYPGPATIEVLRTCLSSPVWYVRHNAAKSLYDLGATLDGDLADIMTGNDRFAREMLEYRWELESRQAAGVAGGTAC